MPNLLNITLRVMHHREPDSFNLDESSSEYAGGVQTILKDLQLISNFSSQLTELDWNDENPGDPFELDFKPMFLNQKVDLIIGYYYFIISRTTFAVPLHPIINEKFWAIFRQVSSVKNIYSQPFSKELLVGWLLITVLIIFSVFLVLKLLKVYNFWDSFQEAVWWVITFVSLKNYNFSLFGISLRILFICGALFNSLMLAIYSASITSALLASEVPINSISALTQFGFSFFARKQTSKYLFVSGLHKTLNSVDNNEVEGLSSFKRVLDGPEGHAHVDNFEGLDYYFKQLTTTDQFCKNVWRLRFAENSLVVSGFFIAKNSPYRDVLNYSLLRLRESGFLRRYNQVYNANRNFDCPKVKRNYEDNLGIAHVFSVFLFLMSSITLVILIFVIENKFFC